MPGVYRPSHDVRELTEIRDNVEREGLKNVVVLEGAARSTNLPNECCDAIFLRDVYHHVSNPEEFDASLLMAVKSGGHVAVMDFEAEPGRRCLMECPRIERAMACALR